MNKRGVSGSPMSNTKQRLVCRCREVSEADVLEAVRDGARSVRGVKVRTRAGTGLCQGQTCGPIIESILKRELGPSFVPDDRPTRGPVKAIPIDVLANDDPSPLTPLSHWERGRG